MSNKSTEEENQYTSFCVFEHNPFKRGSEGGEDGSQILKQLVYKFPPKLNDRSMENFLSVMISLYTFTSLSLEENSLDFISWSNSKVALKTRTLPDGTLLFFVIRAPSIYSDSSIARALDYLKHGLFFILGNEKLNDISFLRKYFEVEGSRICSLVLPPASPDPLPFSFTSIPNAEWRRPSVITTLTELMLMRKDPRIWGTVCFVDGLLVVSFSPLDIIRLFNFVPPGSPRTQVYLTKSQRKALIDYQGCIAQIPDQDIIESSLLVFRDEAVVFYVLTSPNVDNELVESIGKALEKNMKYIAATTKDAQKLPSNTIVYDRELNKLRLGQSTVDFQANAIYAHDSFERDEKLRDVIMHNAREFSLAMNVLSIEHYASVPGDSKGSLEELYEDALKLNPELLQFLQGLRPPQPSSE